MRTAYNFGESFPLTLEADVFLFGSVGAQYTNFNFEQRYSTYVQVFYPLVKESKVDISSFVGAGFSLNGDTHLYGDGTRNLDMVNVGFTASKTVKFGDKNVPVFYCTLESFCKICQSAISSLAFLKAKGPVENLAN